MKNKNIFKYNNLEYFTKNHLQKNNKRPNALYYSTSSKDAFSSLKSKTVKYIFNIVKDKNDRTNNNRTLDNKKEIYIKKPKKYNTSKTYNTLNMTNSSNHKPYFIKKNNYIINNPKNNNKKKEYINTKKDYSSNNNDNIIIPFNLPKNKVIKNIVKNITKNVNVNVSLNDNQPWVTYKNSIFHNKKRNGFIKKKGLFRNCRNKINNSSYNSLHRKNINNLIIKEKEKENHNLVNIIKNYIYSNKKDNIKSSENINNYRKKELFKNNNKKYKQNIKKLYTDVNSTSFSKKNENNKLATSIKLIKNINFSSKPSVFSSYSTSEKNFISTLVSNDFVKQNKNNKINMNNSKKNDNFLLNYTIESNGKDTQEYESKFLNYELGESDKLSTLNYTSEYNNLKDENIKNEYEKPVEEIEEIANQILNNSNYINKRISLLNNRLNNLNNRMSKEIKIFNDDIEELKKGEGIQKVLTLCISQNNNKI